MKKILVLAIMAAFLAPVTAGAYEIVIPYFVDDALQGGDGAVEAAGWTTIVTIVNNSGDDLDCGIRYTGANGRNATPAGNSFALLANSGWAFRPCQDVRQEEGNKVAPGTPLADGSPDPMDPEDQRKAKGPRPPLTVADDEDDIDGYPDEDGEATSFATNKGAMAIFVIEGLGAWDYDEDGPPISAIVQTYVTADRYSGASAMGMTQAVQGGTVIAP